MKYPLNANEVVGPQHFCGRRGEDPNTARPISNDKAIGLTAAECRNIFVNYEFYSEGVFSEEFNFVGELFNEKK